ncbi:hypothetical protein [Bordetella bronchialis]|uniref:Secreted protein n=1 Tax=Bordetella bronchialis TaxID=463025 RepID=A0A193FHZ8_9BORD|nr:hypothetical protein [Bordetella bronchialis]ANN66816.1 hypothetical protein BAU06_11450 [Bordetella bronchialis]ANN71892.1 hypothetical protein BAU08_11645 [Bordetella bronchialis]
MNKIMTATFGLCLWATSVATLAAGPGEKVPSPEYGVPRAKASAGTCKGAKSGEERVGYVVSVGASWFGTNNTTIAFKEQPTSSTYTIESSGYFTNEDDGIVQLTALITALVTGSKTTLYCMGKSPATGRDSFSSVWFGDTSAP